MPALDWDSVAPSDDNDGVREWSDLHDSCIDDEIILAHRSEDRIDTTILEELVLCENCANQKDSLYASTTSRFRFDAWEDRSNVTDIISAPAGDGSIGFTELGFTLDNSDGLYIVPIVDNLTHGAEDAILAGGYAVNASINASRDGEWPLQTDMRAFSSVSNLTKNMPFLRYLLSEMRATKMGTDGFCWPWCLGFVPNLG